MSNWKKLSEESPENGSHVVVFVDNIYEIAEFNDGYYRIPERHFDVFYDELEPRSRVVWMKIETPDIERDMAGIWREK